jgi:4-amino-4-deoxy-L-arabinose transferase-like glycosyltransferase
VGIAAEGRPPARDYWDLLALWGAAILLAVGAFVPWRRLPDALRRLGHRLLAPSPETVLVVGLTLLALALRLPRLGSIPFVLSGDEAAMGLDALRVLRGESSNPFGTGWLSHPTLYFVLQAAFLKMLGTAIAGLRTSSALIGSFSLIIFYAFTRRFFGRWIAFLATLFYAVYHYAIHFARLGLNNIWDPFWALGALFFVTRGIEERRPLDVILGGLFGGLAIYFYMGSRLIPIIVVLYLAYWFLRDREPIRENIGPLLLAGAVALVAAMPLLLHFRAHPFAFSARYNWIGIFPSGWVEQEVARTGKTMPSVLWAQFLKAALAFNHYPDPTFWYRPGIPLLRFFTSIFFVFGLVYAMWRWRQRGYFLVAMWFWLVIIFGGFLLENPPTSPRLVLSIPPVALLVALGMVKVASYVQELLGEPRRTALLLSLALVVISGLLSVQFYFQEYTPSREFGGLNTEVGNYIAKYLRALGPGYRFYFVGAPRMYHDYPVIPYLAPDVRGQDVIEPVQDADFVLADSDAVFVVLPERRGELDVIQRHYPSGALREFRNDRGQLLFIAYEVDL